jgi:hypothetical protein
MDDAFTLHTLANARFAHKIDNAALKDAGTNARKNMIACTALKHDAFNAAAMQKLRQEQPRWTTSDDGNLRSHSNLPTVFS